MIQAMQKKMDMVGVCVCGFLAAFGGGTLRDVLIDRRPFFWVEQQSMLIGVLVLVRYVRQRRERVQPTALTDEERRRAQDLLKG